VGTFAQDDAMDLVATTCESGWWSHHPEAHDPAYRLLDFALVAEREGRSIGGNNVQAIVGAPEKQRSGLDRDVAVWLPSGWWVTLRNQFARAPDAAMEILKSVEQPLCENHGEARSGKRRAHRGSDARPSRHGVCRERT
jgi:hypothetical protein